MPKDKYDDYVKTRLSDIEAWRRKGIEIADIAKKLGVSPGTFYKYQNQHEELREAIKRGNQTIAHVAENSLFDKLKDKKIKEVTVEETVDKRGNKHKHKKVITKTLPADTTAIIFALKNHMPDQYRDRHDVQVNGNINNPFDGMSTADLRKIGKKLLPDEDN